MAGRALILPGAGVVTILDKELKRQVTVDGADYTVAIGPDGFRLTAKGKRTPQVQLRWLDLVSGDAALAVALNASVSKQWRPVPKPAADRRADATGMRVVKQQHR